MPPRQLDFGRVRAREVKLADLVADLSLDDLARATDSSIAQIEETLAEATEPAVVVVQEDPPAAVPAAADPAERDLAWTLARLVVHVTASAEESAALAQELARGVPFHGRSRWEVPWRTVTTIDQCRRRLADSRRIRLASLQMWPASPPSEVDPDPATPTWQQARERFARGLSHEDSHVDQIRNVVKQARAARNGGPDA